MKKQFFMSTAQSSKKRQVSTSSKPRSNQVSLSKISSISHPRPASIVESKPEFKVYQLSSAREETHDDTTAVNFPTEDSYMLKQQASRSSHAQKSPTHVQQQSIRLGQRRVSDPSNNITDYMIKDVSFPSYNQGLNDDNDATLGGFNFSDNPEMNEMLKMLEVRFGRLEKRLETNENLIHLHDESQRLNHMEKRNALAQEELVRHETLNRVSALEHRINHLEDQLRAHKSGVDQKLEDFTRKIEQYLEKFLNTTAHLGDKFDMLANTRDRESTHTKEFVAELGDRLDKVSEDIRDRLQTLYETVENVGKLTNQTASALDSEKYNVRKLEDDFLRLLSASKDMNQSGGDVKWLSEEIFLLKSRQMSILNYLNFGPQNEHSEVYDNSFKERSIN